ncbi:MAG: InlB B-repeat-containing protein [Candidatus Borkfalkiaceae bacterium]|nr:InlB B-repeat-containing protein [Clostridia bacterium]MDY6223979.1 InlB B-repeat-containing protein [Christensenellaceae bacterium]
MKKIGKLLLSGLFCCLISAALISCKSTSQKYEYVFETNCEISIAGIEAAEGEEITLPVPEREGYSFEGWYTDAAFSGGAVAKISADKNATFYARWEKLYALTLNADGGIAAQSKLWLKAGANLAEALRNVTAEKEGLRFGAWFNGDKAVSDAATMPAADLSLTAKYQAAYTAEVYKQNLGDDGYEKETVEGYAYVHEPFTFSDQIEGFEEVVKSDTVKTLTVSADTTLNIFRRYFNRKEYVYAFRSDDPDGDADEIYRAEAKYGETLTASGDIFTKKGYWLVGWKDTSDGTAYSTGISVYNTGEETAPDQIVVKRNTTLRAVWLKGYVNVFGGDDYIYLPENDQTTAYLSRGGLLFKGEYAAPRKEFTFTDDRDDVLLAGRINDDGSFAYFDGDRANVQSTLYTVRDGLQTDTLIYFDEYNGIRYKAGSSVSAGTYRLDENGRYIASFDSGDLAGKTLVLLLGKVVIEDIETSVFRVRNEEEYRMGTVYRGVVQDGALTYYLENYYSLELNGFGTAAYHTTQNGVTGTATYYYVLEGETLTLTNAEGGAAGTARLMKIRGKTCYMFYDEEFDRTFENGAGATLTADGMYSATYTAGNVNVSGVYTVAPSVFGGTILTLEAEKQTYKFLITKSTQSSGGIIGEGEGEGEGAADGETVYTMEVKAAGYGEYYYKGGDNVYYAPLLVTDDPAQGRAKLYGYTSSREFVLVSEGSYLFDEATKLYTYTAETFGDAASLADVLTNPIDVSGVLSVRFCTGSAAVSTASYNVTYWFSYVTEEGTTYTGTTYVSGEDTLALFSDRAAYTASGTTSVGSYKQSDNVITFTAGKDTLYFTIDDGAHTFAALSEAPYRANRYNADGTVTEKEYLSTDGNGGAVYYSESLGACNGTVTKTGKTSKSGAEILRFASGTVTFEFIRLTYSKGMAFAVYDGAYDNNYVSSQGGALSLDGFAFRAQFTDEDGNSSTGAYVLVSENEVRMEIGDTYRYFTLNGYSFTMRGAEYGVYVTSDNRSVSFDEFFELDGYGKLSVFVLDGSGNRTYTGQGTYVTDGDKVTYSYVKSNETYGGEFRIGTEKYAYESSVYGELVIVHEEIVKTYVNEKDWSVLILDNAGNAVKADGDGNRQEGKYTLITEKLLYFVTDDAKDACIYEYDTAKGTATPVKFTARGYYTKELDSLLFSQYGFAIFNGTERCYYNVVNNDVLIYRQNASDPDASEYGFVEENFGAFDNIKEYNGQTYYSNNGFAIQFKREEEGKNKYPAALITGSATKHALETLSFSPSGKDEFTVEAKVLVNGKNVNAYVTREKDESGNTHMYVTVSGYRFDIEISYNGENDYGESLSTYTVTALRRIGSAPAYAYLDNYYKYYVTMGASYANSYKNDIGYVSVNYVYDEEGEETSSYISGSFGEGSRMYDAEGNVISFDGADFEYDDTNGVYCAGFTAADGYTYRLFFALRKHPAYRNTYGYYVYFLLRSETLQTEDGYKVITERIVATDNPSWSQGTFRGISLSKDGVEIAYSGAIISGDKTSVRYISRTTDDSGKITSSVYYTLTFTENSGVEIGEDKEILATFRAVTVETETMKVLYAADGETYVEADSSGTPVLFCLDGAVYLVAESEYDEETNAYTVSAGGKTFVIRLSEDKQSVAGITEKTE